MMLEFTKVFVVLLIITVFLPLLWINLHILSDQCTELLENITITGSVPAEKPKRKNDELFIGDDGEIVSLEEAS